MANEGLLQPASALVPSNRQWLFLRYFTAILIDLVVLNLFVEYTDSVAIDSFTISLFAALVLQSLLKSTMILEHRISASFNAEQSGFEKLMRFFGAWLVLFVSKFVILEAIDLAFGESVDFAGPLHGLVILSIVLVTMFLTQEAVVRIYRWLL